MRDLTFNVTREVLDIGVKILTARVVGIKNTDSNPEFEIYKNSELEKVKRQWEGKKYKDDPILAGFRALHTKVGRSNRDYVASPEGLHRLLLERGRFPHINTLVDIYNLVSIKTGLALGTHGIDAVQGKAMSLYDSQRATRFLFRSVKPNQCQYSPRNMGILMMGTMSFAG
jgi:DNA/RNA-binding domain of Phe-tRNA-synthetase-like protein